MMQNIKNLCDFSPWIEVFIAHDDLQPAQFEEDIIYNLKSFPNVVCSLLLVSKNIVDSNYVQQKHLNYKLISSSKFCSRL